MTSFSTSHQLAAMICLCVGHLLCLLVCCCLLFVVFFCFCCLLLFLLFVIAVVVFILLACLLCFQMLFLLFVCCYDCFCFPFCLLSFTLFMLFCHFPLWWSFWGDLFLTWSFKVCGWQLSHVRGWGLRHSLQMEWVTPSLALWCFPSAPFFMMWLL